MSLKSPDKLSWNRHDSLWTLSLFGTAVGAGVLFLPINAGLGGFWMLVLMTALVWKMTYFAHLGFARLVMSSPTGKKGLVNVVEEHFGTTAGKLITFLYFFSIYPIILIYGVSITNTVDHFLRSQFDLVIPSRAALSFVLIASMLLVMWKGEKLMLKVTEFLVYPLVGFLLLLSLYLIPYWNLSLIFTKPCLGPCLTTLWLTIPVLIFSFNHSPILSSFVISQEAHYGKEAKKKVPKILKATTSLLMGFVMFFVFSCVLSLSPEDLLEAKQLNISVLSYFSEKYSSPFFAYLAPPIALAAIISSFFGHYLGAKEGLMGLIGADKKESPRKDKGVTLFLFLSTWYAATENPSILGLIETLSGPVIAVILFILPVIAVYTVPSLKKFKGHYGQIFVFLVGLLALSSLIFQVFSLF